MNKDKANLVTVPSPGSPHPSTTLPHTSFSTVSNVLKITSTFEMILIQDFWCSHQPLNINIAL